MNWALVSLEAAAPQPWRNGGGLTRELLVWPGGDAWKARISVADIGADGPFSRFERIERWFAVLEGQGVDLDVGGGRQRLTAGSPPFRFSGEAPVQCTLVDGATRDFNLMADPGRARMERVDGDFAFTLAGEALVGVYAHARPAHIAGPGCSVDVPPYHLAWCHRRWHGDGVASGTGAIWLEVRP
jgi:environmental stress-induced protein Ves